MFPFALSSDYCPRIPRSEYDYYVRPTVQSLNPRDRYYNALAEARAAESEMLAEEAARREEELLQRRLQELRQSHLGPQYSAYRLEPYSPYPRDITYRPNLTYRPYNDRLELLRLQVEEEEQLAKLEALRRRRLELEEEERLKTAAERRRRELDGLLRNERARNLREREIGREGERLRLLNECPSLRVIEAPSRVYPQSRPAESPCPFVRYPYADDPLGQKRTFRPDEPVELLVQLPSEEPRAVRIPAEQVEFLRNALPQGRREQPPRTSTAPEVTDLNSLLQQLGFLPPNQRPEDRREEGHIHQARIPDVQRPKTPEKPSTSKASLPPSTSSVPTLNPGQLLTLLANPNQPKQKQEQEKPSVSQVPRSTSPEATLREQLERRLNNEYANEVRDTIQALLNSLNGPIAHQRLAPRPSKVGRSTSTPPASAKDISVPSDKGKSKEIPVAATESKPTTPKDVEKAVSRVREIEQRLHALENEFVFPDKLDFVTPTSSDPDSGPATSHLAYTANNYPIRFYEQSLSRLLDQLDQIDSYEDEELRKKRKDVVQKVGHALEELEQEIEGKWNAKVAWESKKHKVTIEDITSQEEYLVAPPPSPAPQVADKDSEKTPDTGAAPTPHQPTEEATQSSQQAVVIEKPTQRETRPEEASETTIENPTPENQDSIVDSEPITAISPDETKGPSIQSSIPLEPSSKEAPEASQPEPAKESDDKSFITTLSSSEFTEAGPIPEPLHDLQSQPRENSLVESQPDLSATIRPSTPVVPEVSSLTSNTSNLGAESVIGEGEALGGFLLTNGLTTGDETSLKHDISDSDSTLSDWSEVDPTSTTAH